MKRQVMTMDNMKAGDYRTQVIKRIAERIQAERSRAIRAEEKAQEVKR